MAACSSYPPMVGAYGLGARTRFRCRMTLPGRVLRTNGTLEKDAVIFAFDQDTAVRRRVAVPAGPVGLSPTRAVGHRATAAANAVSAPDAACGRRASFRNRPRRAWRRAGRCAAPR
jgi:hypothetical protein